MFRDYKCKNCNEVKLHGKKYGKGWPESIKCPKCKGKMVKQFSPPVISISEGHDGIVYHPASLTPMNQIPGVAGVLGGVETAYTDGE